jgi:hypothetical protein
MPKHAEVDTVALDAAVNAVRAHLTVDIPRGSRQESANGWSGRGELHRVTVVACASVDTVKHIAVAAARNWDLFTMVTRGIGILSNSPHQSARKRSNR